MTHHEDADFPPKSRNSFNPVRLDGTKMLKPSEDPVVFVIEVLKRSPEELNKLDETVTSKQIVWHGSLATMTFAVLDECRAHDDTMIVCYGHEQLDRETGNVTGEILTYWRVSFADAHDFVGMIENYNYSVMEGYIFEAAERFINDDGVFEFRKGIKVMEGKLSV